MNTTGSGLALISAMILSVNFSQPRSRCEAARPISTVSTLFRRRTPCFAQCSRNPCFAGSMPRSLFSSLKMLTRLGGGGTPGCTEKQRPCACPMVGILPKDHDAHLIERRQVERAEPFRALREDALPLLFF